MKKEDLLLSRIYKEENVQPTDKNKRVLLRLEEKGLIRRNRSNYELTEYGQTILVMGYETHKKTEEFEKEILNETPDVVLKKQIILILLSSLLVLLLISLLLLLWKSYWLNAQIFFGQKFRCGTSSEQR